MKYSQREYTVAGEQSGIHAVMVHGQFIRAHLDCGQALDEYIKEANKMCQILGECSIEPLSLEERSNIVAQRSGQNEAHSVYQQVWRRLFEIARIGYADSL